MALLRSKTPDGWLDVALGAMDLTLSDHAHLEKKAAASALKLVADHPDRPGLVRPLAKLAQEELQHFLAVLTELGRLGHPLRPDEGDPYAQELRRLVRSGGVERLVDRLLVGALIEARSCERLFLLAEGLARPGGDPRLAELYDRLARSEGGHETLFLDLAREVGGAAADARADAMAEAEARIVAELPVLARIH
ncbi:MAG: tRNA isopentenyl-2-thiomethyl-A-37 hydroxylase MiaE [Anaeromyxobacter sp.]